MKCDEYPVLFECVQRGVAASCQESRQVEPVSTLNEMETVEPVARIIGYKQGYCVIEPVDRTVLLPAGMALYRAPLGR